MLEFEEMENFQLSVIDLSSSDRLGNAKKLTEAMETVGFVYLDNVPGFDKEAEKNLHKAAEWFFSRPLEEKKLVSPKKWNKHAKGVYRGYVPISVEDGHLREQYETGETLPEGDPDVVSGNPLYEPTPWPKEDGGDIPFRQLLMTHYKAMASASLEFVRLTALGLGLDEDVFVRKFLSKPVSSLRIMHYPTYGKSDKPTFTCEEHIDFAFVTLLITFSYPGLEIRQEDGSWMAVEPRPGSIVVNIGELLSRLTNGRYKATYHRVRDTGIERYSVPFFLEPCFYSEFEFPDDSSKIMYGTLAIKRMRRHTYQYEHVPEFNISQIDK